MSAAIGFALSAGLVWWEQVNSFSIRGLGAFAIGFAIIVLAFVMYQSIRQVGGNWAGAAIALGASILIAQLLQLNAPIVPEVVQTVTVVALIVGIMAFLHHSHHYYPHFHYAVPSIRDVRHDMADLYRDRHISDGLTKKMRALRKEAKTLDEHPKHAGDVLLQIKRMLPAEGYLTGRMAQLRAKAHRIRNAHIARLEETHQVFAKLPAPAKKKASAELAARYNQIPAVLLGPKDLTEPDWEELLNGKIEQTYRQAFDPMPYTPAPAEK